jgi:hypothetical protein
MSIFILKSCTPEKHKKKIMLIEQTLVANRCLTLSTCYTAIYIYIAKPCLHIGIFKLPRVILPDLTSTKSENLEWKRSYSGITYKGTVICLTMSAFIHMHTKRRLIHTHQEHALLLYLISMPQQCLRAVSSENSRHLIRSGHFAFHFALRPLDGVRDV